MAEFKPQGMIVICPRCGKQIRSKSTCGATNCSHCGKVVIFDREVFRRRHWKLVERLNVKCPRCGALVRPYRSYRTTGVTTCNHCKRRFAFNEHGIKYLRDRALRTYYRHAERKNAREVERVRQLKIRRVAQLGGACVVCGYDRYFGALDFHHIDPTTKQEHREAKKKDFDMNKYLLLCSNCHRELEAGLVRLPVRQTSIALAQLSKSSFACQ